MSDQTRMVVMLDDTVIYDGDPVMIKGELEDHFAAMSFLYAGEDVRKKLLIINKVDMGARHD